MRARQAAPYGCWCGLYPIGCRLLRCLMPPPLHPPWYALNCGPQPPASTPINWTVDAPTLAATQLIPSLGRFVSHFYLRDSTRHPSSWHLCTTPGTPSLFFLPRLRTATTCVNDLPTGRSTPQPHARPTHLIPFLGQVCSSLLLKGLYERRLDCIPPCTLHTIYP